ncbi:AAA family ATPase [Paenibacillus thiaminolyticus]|uniref:AAA family ATPase n=1 Tax=Paenibacillus thiaminolyticus TaxID=49283 RepID=UPI002542911D|nr:AAA family ATPase [Paenibacillus thiaminolyticus]WII36851.1 AAA family ATPase [Paenibacillus thiaminolyticus]
MKRIVLERLTFRNFKGFRNFELITHDGNVDVYGDNGTGKTSIFDAFMWGLFGKDSSNRTDFEIKELDGAGNVLQHGLDHEVELVLSLDGRRKTFRRVYAEKWTKKRGAARAEFTGHTTSYFVDGVPVKQGEYAAAVDAVIKEDVFKLLTNPAFFNEQLKWEQRRRILLEVCGDITDAEVIHSNKALERLPDILNGRSIEDHRKVVAARRSDINKEIEKIPVRIDEARRSAPEIADLDEELLQEDIQTLRSRILAKEEELSRIQSGGEIAVKEKRLREIETDLIGIKNDLQLGAMNLIATKRKGVDALHREVDALRRKIDDAQRRIETNGRNMKTREAEADHLRTEWEEVHAQELPEHQHEENCPSCGQALPPEQVQAAHEKELNEFNVRKAKRLEGISARGKEATAEVQRLQREIKQLTFVLEENQLGLETKQSELSAAESELATLRAGMLDPAADPRYQQLQGEAQNVRQEIEQLRSCTIAAAGAVQHQIAGLRSELELLEAEKAKIGQARAIEQRIVELEKQEKALAAEFEQLEQELFLTEEFIRTKVSMLETKINSKFRYARFKLFDQQVNGGLKEVCMTTFKGVPYDGGLNNAARINVGLDIINTLSEHYGFSAPIFVDNAEAVTKLIDTDAQVIRLVVSEADKQLRIEPNDPEVAFQKQLDAAIRSIKKPQNVQTQEAI